MNPEKEMGKPMAKEIRHSDNVTNTTCKGACTGYKTQAACPPLIVLAVRSVQGEPLCCRGRC